MTDKVTPGLIAIAVGCVLAVVVLVPFVALAYRRRGSLTPGYVVAWFALLIYVLALGAYTTLPLPTSDAYACVPPQTHPFFTIKGMLHGLPHSPGAILRDFAFQQVVLNVLLFLPWGFFVRGLGRRGIIASTLSGLAISLAIETTQLTGLWGIYPCAYREFDTDDLITNTIGAFGGAVLAWFFIRLDTTQVRDPAAPTALTVWRRLLGMLLDLLAVELLSVGVAVVIVIAEHVIHVPATLRAHAQVEGVLFALAVQVVMTFATGSTVGEQAVLLTGVPRRIPAAAARPLRLLFGIGGYLLLGLVPGPGRLLQGALVLVSLVFVFPTRDNRGLALLVSDMTLADRRAERRRYAAASSAGYDG